MRPSDENQASSTRPNLMSASRPSPGSGRGGEDSILAKLERDPARRQARRPPLRLLGAGAGAVVAAALTATLVWLAADNGKPQAMLAQAAEPAPAPAAAPPQASGAAALIDEPLPPPPPLRLLRGPSMAPPPAAVPEQRPPAPVKAAAETRPRLAAAVRAERPAPQAARPRPPAARPAPRLARAARPPAPPRQAEQAVDSDVALISAVIVHANGHAEAREEEARARD